MNKKQVVGFSVLIALSIAFVLCFLYLPHVYIKLCDFNTEEIIIEQNFNFIEFVKLGGYGSLGEFIFYASGPMWLTVGTIFFNLFSSIGCVFLCVLSVIGLIFAIKGKQFSFKNSAIYKLAGFVGFFIIFSFVAEIVGFIVLTSLANNLIIFKPLLGCFVNLAFAIVILISSHLVKNKESLLNKNKIRDCVFFLLTAICSAILAILLITQVQFNAMVLEASHSTILGLNKIATEFAEHPFAGDIPFGICFYVMILVVICLVFVAIYSLIGLIMVLCGKTTNWLSIRVKRWSRVTLDMFSILFVFLICICIILSGGSIVWIEPERVISMFSNFVFVESVLPFVLLILTRFIGVYQKDNIQTNSLNNN